MKKRAGMVTEAPAPTRIKVLSLGAAGVGKSCIIKQSILPRSVSIMGSNLFKLMDRKFE